MTPASKVATGLELAAEGFAELRAERADLARRLSVNREVMAGGEQRALSLRFEAMRDRQERSLSGALPDRMRLRDGMRVPAPSLDAETSRSLDLYVPSHAGRAAPPVLRRGLLARLLGTGAP